MAQMTFTSPHPISPRPNSTCSESLAFHYGTDKSHDDHKYTDLYALLLDHTRHSAMNISEVGVMAGTFHALSLSFCALATRPPANCCLLFGACCLLLTAHCLRLARVPQSLTISPPSLSQASL